MSVPKEYLLEVRRCKNGQFRLCLRSVKNGELIMTGEPLKNRVDANTTANDVRDGKITVVDTTVIVKDAKETPA